MQGQRHAYRPLHPALRAQPQVCDRIPLQGGGTITIRNESGSEVLLNESMKDGANKFEFTTGSGNDYYIRLDYPQILDNIKVYSIVDKTPPTTPANLTAALDENQVWVNLTWDGATDEDSGCFRLQCIPQRRVPGLCGYEFLHGSDHQR